MRHLEMVIDAWHANGALGQFEVDARSAKVTYKASCGTGGAHAHLRLGRNAGRRKDMMSASAKDFSGR